MKSIAYIVFLFLMMSFIITLMSYIVYSILQEDIKIGFPFIFYFEFSAYGNDFKNFSWFPKNFIINHIIHIIIFVFFFLLTKKQK